MKYHIPSGTEIMRMQDTGISPEWVVSTKDVAFDSFDLIDANYWAMDDFPGTPDTSRPKQYTFKLPPEAAPYTHIRVDAHCVRREKENDNENN